MKKLLTIFSICMILNGCSDPVDPRKSNNPIYSSVELVDSGSSIPCVDCLILEIQNISARISYGTSPDECSNQGSGAYTSIYNEEIEIPDSVNTLTTWQAQLVSGASGSCHSSNLNLELRWISGESPTFLDLTINGKVYKIKRLN